MGRNKTNKISSLLRNKDDESTFELDLAPMLALMVTLIPVMLLSVVFVKVKVIDSPVPQIVAQAINEDRNKKDREVSLTLSMNNKRGFIITVDRGSRGLKKIRIPKVNNQWDYEGLYKQAYNLKVKHPKVFQFNLRPNQNVLYNDIVQAMDELRTIRKSDKKVEISDAKTNKIEATDVMFPDVIFSNVVEG